MPTSTPETAATTPRVRRRGGWQWLQWSLALALLPALAGLDHLLSEGRRGGYERKALRGALVRLDEGREADGAILLGSSTSRDWVKLAWLPGVLGESSEAVIAGHINGCQQDCTWAQTRRLLAEDRHFRVALYGTNQYQMCEDEHSKRVLQQLVLAPAGDVPALGSSYLHTQRPLRWLGRYAFGRISGAYADTSAVQQQLGAAWMGRTRVRDEWRFLRVDAPVEPRRLCGFADDEVRYKAEVSRRLYADLSRLADEVFILLLPDRSLCEADDPEVARAWEAHRALQRELVAEHANLRLLDLTAGQPYACDDFKDAAHLHPDRYARQRDAFARELERARARATEDPR